VVQSTLYVVLGIVLLAGVAGIFVVVALRLTSNRRNAALAFGLFLVAVTLGIAAIATLTFFNKSRFG
jgi:predicted membrane channel-forming protein YqfA (hemolysin III family)